MIVNKDDFFIYIIKTINYKTKRRTKNEGKQQDCIQLC